MNCTNCGNALRPGDQFCLKCGGPAPPSNMDSLGQGAPASPPLSEDNKPPQPAQAYPPQTAQAHPPQQPQAYPPSDAQAQAHTLYGMAMVFSLIAGIMLLALDFGGWYNRDDYNGIEVWGSVGPFESPLSFFPFLGVAGSLIYCSYISYQGFSSKMGLQRGLIMRGFVISIIVFVIVIVGGAALIALTWDNDSQWLGAGFYGGAIGSLLTVLLFWMVLKNTPHTKVDKRAGYAAQPYGAQHPYPQTQASQPTQPTELSPQPDPTQEPQVTEPEESGEPIPQEEYQPAEEEEQKPREEPQPEAQQPTQEPQPAQQQFQQPQQQQYQQPYYPQQQQQPQQQTYPCRTCGRPLRYVPEYRRWYCDTCRQYV